MGGPWSRRRVLAALAAAPGLGAWAGCGREAGEAADGRAIEPVPGAPTALRDVTAEWAEARRAAPRAHAGRDRVALALLELAAFDECQSFPVSEQLHARQAATRALRAAPDDEELAVAALCHDLGSLVGKPHAGIAARMLERYVRPELVAVVAHHSIFQRRFRSFAPRQSRELHRRYRDAPWYELALRFTEELDQPSFDPAYDPLSVAELEPMVRRVLADWRYPAWAPPVGAGAAG